MDTNLWRKLICGLRTVIGGVRRIEFPPQIFRLQFLGRSRIEEKFGSWGVGVSHICGVLNHIIVEVRIGCYT